MENEIGNNFLRRIIRNDVESGEVTKVVTRFPPEPNGYLHIGHAKSIHVNFELAKEFSGVCHLRFDDTNPEKECQEYIDSIQEDVRWLGYEWHGEIRYASNYFEQLYKWACDLVDQGLAYVCDLSPEESREYRGTLTRPGVDSPYRDRSISENRDLLERMRQGEFDDGSRVLRAKISMASPNINLRDPVLYRIRKHEHHQTGTNWVIYPSYDFAHGQEDAIEGITHSICTLEFEDHRPLYDWFLDHLPISNRPRQFEFGRLNTSYTITSKRKLGQLIEKNIVSGWDDPRMPTIAGMRRRGFTPNAIRKFCEMIGTTRSDGVVDVAMLEHAIRDDLNENAPRAMAVLKPIKLLLENLSETYCEELQAPCHPNRPDLGSRKISFSRELYIDEDDFREEANKKYKRLVIGKRVRLRNAYIVQANRVERDADGNISIVYADLIPDTLGSDPADGVKAKGVIHWVCAKTASRATVRLYDRLFNHPSPDKGDLNFLDFINEESIGILEDVRVEASLTQATSEQAFQFEREGYFVADRYDYSSENLVFNRIIGLRDTWQKIEEGA